MPAVPIIDAHVHLYDPKRIRYRWMQDQPELASRHLLAEFETARGALDVAGIVWVEVGADPGQQLAEARFIADLAARAPRVQGMVAAVPLENGAAVEADLAQLSEQRIIKGVRRLLQDEPDPAYCLRPGFIEGIKLLPRYGLSFDICVYHRQLAQVVELARRCPEVSFILDHIGKPGIRQGLFDPWRDDLRRLAALPNVWCKLSGVVTEADAGWTRDQLRLYIRHAAECFGFDRLAFGSDWPVSELTHGYAEWLDIVEWELADCSELDRQKLFRDNAITFYRLEA